MYILYSHYGQENDIFKRKFTNVYNYSSFLDLHTLFFEIGLSALRFKSCAHLCWIIYAMCSADFSCVNGSVSHICVRRIACKD